MGLLDKIKGMVNPDTIDENYDDDFVFDETDDGSDYGFEEYPQQPAQPQPGGGYQTQPQQRPQNPNQNQQQQYQAPVNNQQGGMGINANNLELRLIKPERYESVRSIADHLLNRRTVILNVEAMSKEDARKMIEFLTGVIYSINGGLQRAQNDTFVLTPNNVDMANDKLGSQKASRDMFNN